MIYDRMTRVLHLGIALGGVLQLLSATVMVHPKPGRAGDAIYAMHEAGGQVLLAILIIHWLWCLLRRGEVPFVALWPWFAPSCYPGLLADARLYFGHALHGKLPDIQGFSPLVVAVQGIGLLLATLLGISGVLLSLATGDGAAMVGWLHDVKEGHEVLGGLMWAYLLLHAGMAMLHHWAGHDTLRMMLRIWQKPAPAAQDQHNHTTLTGS
ncbi:MAG: cytochrome b/b6 domain-containing protein [Magnetococcales bacterium]|nr:cytochrome b/b6 domain-containing protein [Magnetococcales bacterium]